jgi:predicted ATPase
MANIAEGFQSLPIEYQNVIQLAQDQHQIGITPLQTLVGGRSGAMVFLVSVSFHNPERIEHFILKLDRKNEKSPSDEIRRHDVAVRHSPPDFAAQHLAQMAFDRLEADDALAIFYSIAGHSLRSFLTLSQYHRQSQLETLLSATNHYLLDEWNANLTFEPVDHPQALLKRWLGFRLSPGQKVESFLREVCRIHPDNPGFIILGDIFPNPLAYARNAELWGPVRPCDVMVGLQHGDLNTNNILARFSRNGDELEGYYLIDFALFKENMPLLYDQRYLEMSFLVQALSQTSIASIIGLVHGLAERDIVEAHQVPIEMVGVNAAIRAGRVTFEGWVRDKHPSLHDDLWGQYWLAGVAAGLSYCHKVGLPDEVRLAGMIYAAANLKQYFRLFGLQMPVEATQLYSGGEFGSGAVGGTALASPSIKALPNLPVPPTNFIGREAALEDIKGLLLQPQVRLVTLTGPGGTGKTRLGLEAGRAMLEHFSHGVYFIDLAAIRDPDLVVTTAAHTIGIREGGGRSPLENTKDYLANKQMLLLFDNFEQIVGAAPVVAELLAAAPGVKALVTSRIALRLRGEHEYPIPPLSTPSDTGQPLTETLEYEAVALFRQQAQSVQPQFEITEENSAAVIEICRRLDGLPLAIEIAAARIKMLPLEAVRKRLDQSLKLLVGGAKDLPDRQQTLRRTIDWSFELLGAEEQSLFARLGVFAGGFTLEAAERACNPTGDIDVFSGIETLLNSSLLRRVKSVSDEPRFDMLQTLRDYALEKAEGAGIAEELHRAHCEYFAGLIAGELGAGIYSAQSVMWLQRFNEEHDNCRAALSWALQHEEGIPLAVTMITPGLFWFWYRYGHLQEGREWTERALDNTQGLTDSPIRAAALIGAASLAMWAGDLIVADRLARESVEISERLGSDPILAEAKFIYGVTLINQGRDKDAYLHLVDALELFDQQHLLWLKGTALVHLANVSLGLGDPGQAVQWLDMARSFMKEVGDPWHTAFALSNYGEVARAQGDYDQAEQFYRQTAEWYAQADAPGDQARLVNVFGYIAQHKGDFEEAKALFYESLNDFRELGNQRGIAECLAGLAGLAAEQGKCEWAAPLLSAAESQLKALGSDWWPADRVEIERARDRLRSTLQDEFETCWAKGSTMSLEEAVIYASPAQ